MRTIRLILAGTLGLCLVGLSGFASSAQETDTPALATGVFTFAEGALHTESEEGQRWRDREANVWGRLESDDPRIDGTLGIFVDGDTSGDADGEPSFAWGSMLLENDAGTWAGPLAAWTTSERFAFPAWLIGDGAYAGLITFVEFSAGIEEAEAGFEVVAVIYEGEVPPVVATALQTTPIGVAGQMAAIEVDDFGETSDEDGIERLRGRSIRGSIEMSDPRLTGSFDAIVSLDAFASPEAAGRTTLSWGSMRVENSDGSWDLEWSGGSGPDGADALVARGTGSGDYEGWSARLEMTPRGGLTGMYDVEGMVIEGELPPLPEPPDVAPPDVTPPDIVPPEIVPPAMLFDGVSDPELALWTGKSEGVHSGEVRDDPVRPNNRVLILTDVDGAGDMFSQPILATPGQEYALCFDYLGMPVYPHGVGNGGAIGIADGMPGNHRWLAGATTSGGVEQALLVDDLTWHQVRVEFEPEIDGADVGSFRIMLADLEVPPRDVYFDDVMLVPSDEEC